MTNISSTEDRDAVLARIGQSVTSRPRRVAVAESLTSGHIAAALGAAERAAEWFAGGVVAYQMRTKTRALGVSPHVDPCSEECAESLAAGVLQLMDADIAISATGVGGPDREDGHPPGTVHIGWATAQGVGSQAMRFAGDPGRVIEQTVDASLSLLENLASAHS